MTAVGTVSAAAPRPDPLQHVAPVHRELVLLLRIHRRGAFFVVRLIAIHATLLFVGCTSATDPCRCAANVTPVATGVQ